MSENKVLDLSTLKAASVSELQGWKEKQQNIVIANPYVAITDNKSYEEAKKNRTALVKARTAIQDQEKIIKSKLNAFKSDVMSVSQELIDITKPYEEKQQAEVKRYEAEKEAERERKREEERIKMQKIKDAIAGTELSLAAIINGLTYEQSLQQPNEKFEQTVLKAKELTDFDEFEIEFDDMVARNRKLYSDKAELLKEEENERIEALSKSQAAKIDQVYRVCSIEITQATESKIDTLMVEIESKFITDFDFGEHVDKWFETQEILRQQAAQKIEQLKADKKAREEREASEKERKQRENLHSLQQSLMKQILGLTVFNFEKEAINFDKLKETKNEYDTIPTIFFETLELLEQTQENKFVDINKELEKMKALNLERVDKLISIGFVLDDAGVLLELSDKKYSTHNLWKIEDFEKEVKAIEQYRKDQADYADEKAAFEKDRPIIDGLLDRTLQFATETVVETESKTGAEFLVHFYTSIKESIDKYKEQLIEL